jgi:signal transduction histidine kinase
MTTSKLTQEEQKLPIFFKKIPPTQYQIFIENLVESIDLGLCVINRGGDVCVWNKQMETLLYPKKLALGFFLMDILEKFEFDTGGGLLYWGDIMARILEQGERISFSRVSLQISPERVRLVDIQGYPLKTEVEPTLGAVLTFNDVTQAVIVERQLIQTEKVQSLAELGANLAHEIRNPLNAISLNVQLLKELSTQGELNQEEAYGLMDLVLDEIRRTNHLITDFLEFARPKQPKMILGSVWIPLEKSIKLLYHEMNKKNITLVTDIEEVDPVYHDAGQLQQIFINILLNAIQWTPEYGKISVGLTEINGYVVITFIDTGPGIPKDHFDRIFDVFFSTREGGTGLGLSTVKSLVKGHQGRVVAKNHKGGGAKFEIYLPTRATSLQLGMIPLTTSEQEKKQKTDESSE